MKKLSLYLLILTLVFSVLSTSVIADTTSFTDTKGHWAESSIERMAGEGHIGGYPDGSFKPEGQITRAEFTAILTRIVGIDEVENPFKDANDAKWADGIIGGAEDVGIIEKSEYGSYFQPNTPITRLEMSKMITRAFILEDEYEDKFDTYGSYDQGGLIFKDAKEISNDDAPYVAFATDLGIIGGYPDKTFKPFNQATRAEAVVMLLRFIDNDIEDIDNSTGGSGDVNPNPDDNVNENPAYDPDMPNVYKWVNETRISPNYISFLNKQTQKIENGTASEIDLHKARFHADELLWSYYKGSIPVSEYEEETLDRIANRKGKADWDDLSEFDKALYSTYGGSIEEAILLSYSFDKDEHLEWVVVRPAGMRHAFKLSVDDPSGSVVLNRGWAGVNDAKFDAVYAEIATPQLLNQIIDLGVPISVRLNSHNGDEFDESGFPSTQIELGIRAREIKRANSNNVVKILYGGDFAIKIGGISNLTNADIVEGSTIIPAEFLEIKPYTKGQEKYIVTDLY
ncbi:S-layer homology domain-containing protein [Chengkuizengella axinellae]|uniref:S-layer homology domain-containing protein n=1 Tax=Chengkuizengella axinellae TaxID=3064388 RepID=A0ABT9J595_9BACL|nr:S-layer homology domain-containing protein [Chengkuizengella sp. 2205SS18-9]MDP5276119.1 S-layer homology domain-containing protein [Chengkuizengella sp. 2205SS18-9]